MNGFLLILPRVEYNVISIEDSEPPKVSIDNVEPLFLSQHGHVWSKNNPR